MSRTYPVWLLAVATVVGGASTSEASFFCRRPCYRVVCAPLWPCGFNLCRIPVLVRCFLPPRLAGPLVITHPPLPVPKPPPMPEPAPVVLPPAPVVSVPSTLPPLSVPARPVTHQEFAAAFRPAPGHYEVVLLHPGRSRPVTVFFTLPDGKPRVHVYRRDLIFDYGCGREVAIRFQIGGKVRVTSR